MSIDPFNQHLVKVSNNKVDDPMDNYCEIDESEAILRYNVKGDIQKPLRTSNGQIADGGRRMSYETGAVREPSTGKGRYDLIPAIALKRLAIWYELGARKYSPRNWENGMPTSRFMDSALRHLNSYNLGDDGEDHLSAVLFNIMGIMFMEEYIPELQDIPNRSKKR